MNDKIYLYIRTKLLSLSTENKKNKYTMEQYQEYLEAVITAFLKMNELKTKSFPHESIDAEFCEQQDDHDNESVLVKEYTFSSPKKFIFHRTTFTSLSAKILLIKNQSVSGIQMIFKEKDQSFFFEVGMGTGKDITPFILLKKNEILPSLETFQKLFPLRSMEFAQFLGCDGDSGYGCD